MLLERRQGLDQPLLCYGIGVICLCVLMFMLGSTMTLWTMQFAFDQTDNPVLEGYSVPTAISNLTPAMKITPTGETPPLAKREVNEQGLLRPPNTRA
jgi:hypothetical protein